MICNSTSLPVSVPGDAAFVKLSCSPAHRRAVSAMSAQFSVEDTSSSVTSRSVSPLRDHEDLSTGLFDANNPKVVCFRKLTCVHKKKSVS